jgi:WD40 repeat protein
MRRIGTKAVVSSNDKKARYIDLDTRETEHTVGFPFAVNCSALSPDRNLLCVVGDSTATLVVNVDSFENVMSMDEHRDYSFACCWSPDGRLLATGNQDKTTR